MEDAKLLQCPKGKIAEYNDKKHRWMGAKILWLKVVTFIE